MRARALIVLVLLSLVAAPTLGAQARWRLQELYRVGDADEGLGSFNNIRDFQLDARNQLWVLDFQTRTLRLFGADGTPIKELARRGQGPGEIANANGFRPTPDGRMVMRDHSNARFNVYAADGTPLPSVTAMSYGYGYLWDAAFDGQGRLVEMATVRKGEEYERALLRWSTDFARADTMNLPATACSPLPPPRNGIRGRQGFAGYPFEPRLAWTIDADGAFWCANTDEYRIRRFAFGATAHDRELTLPNQPRIPIPNAERDSAIRALEEFLTRIGGATDPWDKGSVKRDIGPLQGFTADDQGRLWVLRELPGRRFEFDVWDRAGRRIAVVPVQARRSFAPIYRIRGDRLALLTQDDDDVPVVVVHRIVATP